MELCVGSLATQLEQSQQQPCTPTQFLEQLTQIAAGLEDFHRKQLIFNDLKPDNLLVGLLAVC